MRLKKMKIHLFAAKKELGTWNELEVFLHLLIQLA